MFLYVILQYFLSIQADTLLYLFPVILYVIRGYLRRLSELELKIEKIKNEEQID